MGKGLPHYDWAEKDWLLNLKMNGPEPFKIVYVVKKGKKKSIVENRNDLIKKHSQFA
jgi:ABC-type sulfate transport system substrate-binding protein